MKRGVRLIKVASVTAAWLLIVSSQAHSSTILSPVAAVSAAGSFSANFAIGNTINQSGLSTGFTSGVTDFDTYIAGNPLHASAGSTNDWSAPSGVASTTLDYDLGSAYTVDRIAYWNEESVGVGMFTLSGSLTSPTGPFTPLGTFNPTDNPNSLPYKADVFAFGPIQARYMRLEVARPASSSGAVSGAELAFSVTVVPVPEPLAVGGGLSLLLTLLTRRFR